MSKALATFCLGHYIDRWEAARLVRPVKAFLKDCSSPRLGLLEITRIALGNVFPGSRPQGGRCPVEKKLEEYNGVTFPDLLLHIHQVDTYAGEDTELSQVVDRAFCQIKTFTDGGANRKTYVDEQRLAMGRPAYKCQPAQQL